MVVNTITEYDKYIAEREAEAKRQYPEYVRYEVTENGDLLMFSYGAYPTIIKGYCEPITIV